MSTTSTARAHDVIVVGGRCAGASTAMLLARQGYDVLVVDRASLPERHPVDPSIARGGVVQLQRWGLLDAVLASGAPPLRRVVFHADGSSVTRQIKDRRRRRSHRRPPPPHPRRASSPTPPWPPARPGSPVHVDGTTREPTTGASTGVFGRTENGPFELRARFVIGADGVRSRIARLRRSGDAAVASTDGRHPLRLLRRSPQWDAVEYFLGDRSLQRHLPDPPRRSLRLGRACPPRTPPRLREPGEPSGVTFDRMLRHASPLLAERLRRRVAARHRCAAPAGCPTTCCRPPDPAGRSSVMPATTVTRSPATASRTPSATPSSWPTPSDAALRRRRTRPTPWPAYQDRATA